MSLSPWSEVSQEDLLAKEPAHPPPALASWTHCSVQTVGGLLYSLPLTPLQALTTPGWVPGAVLRYAAGVSAAHPLRGAPALTVVSGIHAGIFHSLLAQLNPHDSLHSLKPGKDRLMAPHPIPTALGREMAGGVGVKEDLDQAGGEGHWGWS